MPKLCLCDLLSNKMSSWRLSSRLLTLLCLLVLLLSGELGQRVWCVSGSSGDAKAEAGGPRTTTTTTTPLLLSSHSFLQSECEHGVAFTSDLVSQRVEPTNNVSSSSSSSPWDVFGDLILQQPRSFARWSCPKSIGVAFHSLGEGSDGREAETGGPAAASLSPVLVSSRNSSALIDQAHAAGGFSVELWLTFLGPQQDENLGGRERLLFALDEREGEGEEGGAQALCSANWPSFSFQLRQKGRRLVVEFRWSKTSSGVPLCDIVKTEDILFSGEPSNATGAAEEWALPKHVAVTLEVGGEEKENSAAVASPSPKLVVYLDGSVSSETNLPATRADVFRDLWDRGHKLSFGAAYASSDDPGVAIAWAGVVHQVKIYAGALSLEEVSRNLGSGLPNSAPVAFTKSAEVREDAIDAGIALEGFDLDQIIQRAKTQKTQPQWSTPTRFIITSLPSAGTLRDIDIGEDITIVTEATGSSIGEEENASPASPDAQSNASSESIAARYPYSYGYKLQTGSHTVGFTPERDAFSFRRTREEEELESGGGDHDGYSYQNPAYASFEYVACDDRLVCSSPATVFVHVLEVNDPPLAVSSSTYTHFGLINPVTFYSRDVDHGEGLAAKKAHSVFILEMPKFGILNSCLDRLNSSNSLTEAVSSNEKEEDSSSSSNDDDDDASLLLELDNNDLCYEFTDLAEARSGLERGEEIVATDSAVFMAQDSENATSENNATLQIEVVNPLASENQTVECEEDGAALIRIRFGDLVAVESKGKKSTLSMMQQQSGTTNTNTNANALGRLGVRIASIPKHGALLHQRTARLSNGSLSEISSKVRTGQFLLPSDQNEDIAACGGKDIGENGKDKCITLKYVPDENFFNSPNLLEGSQAAKYRDMGLVATVPNDTFTFEVAYEECCRSPAYQVNLRVSNTEDESNITFSKGPIVGHFMQAAPIPGLAIWDVDLYADLFLVDLQVTAGLLNIDPNLDALDYITFLIGDGHDDEKMVFRGLLHKVNEALSNLTYTSLKRSGQDLLKIKVTDMDSKAMEFKDSLKYAQAQHTGSVDILIQKSEESGPSESSSDNAKVCVKRIGLCIPERVLYAILLSILMLIFVSPPLYCIYKVLCCLVCRRRKVRKAKRNLSLPSHRNTTKKQSVTI